MSLLAFAPFQLISGYWCKRELLVSLSTFFRPSPIAINCIHIASSFSIPEGESVRSAKDSIGQTDKYIRFTGLSGPVTIPGYDYSILKIELYCLAMELDAFDFLAFNADALNQLLRDGNTLIIMWW